MQTKAVNQCKDRIFESGMKLERLKKEVLELPLDLGSVPDYSTGIKEYFRHYGLDIETGMHHFGTVRSGTNLIATHVFRPAVSERTVFLLHGYVIHSFIFNRFIRLLLERNFTVLALDLPGHGLSSGRPGDIRDFEDYGRVIHDVVLGTRSMLPPPYGIVGHSVGGAGIFEYINTFKSEFKKHVLVSPLIRSECFGLSKIGFRLLGKALAELPLMVTKTSSDREYMDFIKRFEPLRPKKMPMRWLEALFRWNARICADPRLIHDDVLVLQGDDDIVVDFDYNIKFLRKRIPGLIVKMFEGAKHDMFQESEVIRNALYRTGIEYLSGSPIFAPG